MNKQTLVIIPGWGGNHETWSPFMDLAKADFHDVVCIDLPGFGGVECPKTIWGVEHYAEYVKRKMAKLPAGPKVILGHSFGGQVSAYLIAQNPEICEKFILDAGAVFRPKKLIRRAFFFIIAKFGKILFKIPVIESAALWAKKILYKTADSPDYTKTSAIQREIFKKVIRQDLTEQLSKITVPTLIVWGSRDSYLPVKDAYRAHQIIPHSELQIIQGGGHGLHLHSSDKFYSLVKNFLWK